MIQLASRHVLGSVGVPHQPGALEPLPFSERDFFCEPAKVPWDFSLAADGTFRFTSSVRTASPQNNTVFGRVYRTGENWAERPTVILLHGWNAELCYHKIFPYLASRLTAAGVNTATIELPYHMQRRPRGGPVTDFISSHLEGMLEATRQAVADIRALARWLEAQGSPALGLWGFSLGAWLAGLITRWEPRLAAAVLTTPIARMDRAIAELPFCEPVRRSLGRRYFDFGELNLSARPPCMPIRNILLVESCHDLFAPVETIEELWSRWGHPEIWRLAHGHISVLLSVPVMARTVAWIKERMIDRADLERQVDQAALVHRVSSRT